MIKTFDRNVPVYEQLMRSICRKAGRKHQHKRSNDAARKMAEARADEKKRVAEHRVFKGKVRAYWLGKIDEYPS